MPRIKTLSTGSIPSFIDVILNFAESDKTSSLASQDSWLTQMKAKNTGKSIMFGDDTWLKLFPQTFDRADGTTSFYVSDFTEVDTNVSRHIPQELENKDWNVMVLHYLGLDHIGHKSGPKSPNMFQKQREMDNVVNQVYMALTSKSHLESTLFLLLGDHGMNDAGNHGGSSPGETSPALVFISPKLKSHSRKLQAPLQYQEDFRYYTYVEQSDIVPTLSALLGFPIPKNNIGTFIPNFLSFWPAGDDRIELYLRNVEQILQLLRATFPLFNHSNSTYNCETLPDSVEKLACQWRFLTEIIPVNSQDEANLQIWQNSISMWLKKAQEIMSNVATNYGLSRLRFGVTISIFGLGLSIYASSQFITREIISCSIFYIIVFLHGITMFGSSYVEEEQSFWYWATSAWLGCLLIKYSREKKMSKYLMFLGLVLVRTAMRWNQTGNKFAGQPDIAKSFLLKHYRMLWLLVMISYLWNLFSLQSQRHNYLQSTVFDIITILISSAALSLKIALIDEDSPEIISDSLRSIANLSLGLSTVFRVRLIFFIMSVLLYFTIRLRLKHKITSYQTAYIIHKILICILYTQSRVENIPLLLTFELLFMLLDKLNLSVIEVTITNILLQHTSFFALGGSNAISSIDLSNAYNGVDNFNVIVVGVLTFISNWAGPILWTSASNLMLLRIPRIRKRNIFLSHVALLTVFLTCSLSFTMVACILLRTHLFVWTVFSPKFLYSLAWSLGQHLCVNLVFGGLLYWVGTYN